MLDLLITGASGFLGAHLMRCAKEKGHTALGLVGCHPLAGPGRSVALDLTDTRALRDLVLSERPRAIIHAGAITSPDRCEAHPEEADAVNVTATDALAMAASIGDAHLTFISTDLVFDGARGMYTETDSPNPISHYGRTKAQAEHVVRTASPEFAIVRPSFIYGEPLAEQHASYSHTVIHNLRNGIPTRVFHDQYRSPVPAYALAGAILEIADRRLSGVWHVAGPERVSRSQFARTLARVAGLDPAPLEDVSMDEVALPAPRPRDVSLNIDKTRFRLQSTLPCLTDGFHFLYGKGG